jgi:hypothetical protein
VLFRNPFSNRNRKVLMHLQGGTAEGIVQPGLTIEGVLAGETRRHYILWAPKILEQSPEKGTDAVEVSGHVEIPRERVMFFQIVG